MKKFFGCLCMGLALAGFAPVAYSQTSEGQFAGDNAQVRQLVDQALKDRFSAGDQDAAIVSSDGQVTGLSGTLTGEDDKKDVKYRYEKRKGAFQKEELPARTFNNIPYPY